MTLPAIPDPHALAVLALVVLALFLFSRENIAIETSSLFILVLLTSGFAAFPYVTAQGEHLEAVGFFSGFGHEALVAVCALMIAGNGDVIEPEPHGVMAIGSGGSFALAAARALVDVPELSAVQVVEKAMAIAADICVFTNHHITVESFE